MVRLMTEDELISYYEDNLVKAFLWALSEQMQLSGDAENRNFSDEKSIRLFQ